MKKKFTKLLCLCLAMLLSACSGGPIGGASSSSSSSSSSSASSSSSSSSNSSSSSSSDSSSNSSSNSSSDSSSSGGNTSGDCSHRDNNDNGVCDDCNDTVAVTFDFFNVNDIHGKFSDSGSQPGVDELTTYLKNARANNPNTVLLSSGDTWQGTAEAGLTKGHIFTDWMNELDFAAMTLGNHEFDWGDEIITENAAVAEFPFLACNIYNVNTNQLMDYCQPSVMVESAGVQIGIIGAIGDCYSSIASDFSKNFYFKTGSALTNLVKAESNKLRADGADFIIYAIHDGYGMSYSSERSISDSELASYYDISLSQGYVDLVFEGHTHQNYILKDSQGVYHLQGGGDNDGITHTQVTVNPYGTDRVNSVRYVGTGVYSNLSDDPIVNELLEKYRNEVEKANEVLGTNISYRNSTYLRKLVAELYAKKGEELWSNYDIVLGGGFMSVRSPYNLAVGQVKYSDLYTLFPFNNQLVLCSISGTYLKSKFINSTNSNYYIYLTDYGKSIQSSISNAKTYYVVVDTYTSTYKSNRLTELQRYGQETYARDLLAEYIKKGGLS